MILQPLALSSDRDLPAALLTELTALYASNREFHALSGDFPDPDDIRPEQVATALADELADPDVEVLLARESGRLTGIAVTLAHHPDPADPDPWIGLLMVDAGAHRRGHGRRLAALVEDRLRAADRTAVRLAVLDDNPGALAFWTALGYEVVAHRPDRRRGRPCAVLRKTLRTPRPAARVAVVDPEGAVYLFRYDNPETGVHWALPGGGLETGETPREGAQRELREETGWTDVEPGPLLCTWEHDFSRFHVHIRQHEHIYVAHGPHREPAGPGLAAAQAEDGILSGRWWSREELAEEAEPVWPPGLARLLTAWEQEGSGTAGGGEWDAQRPS
ncbi:bifunctional GNAT family N-acetyltransferase/NUDIX hydrolase [Streptomyces sp. NPDC005574]|uniref:bifunctional GNAT family N-acetyltransferase/NUDIX hydrolase n=1 Tax=Streptomyces sp. NPDC005574 TaxID=3156891 RepID=UPI0033A5D3E5